MESLEEQKKLKEYEEPEGLKKLGKYPHRSFREVRARVLEKLRKFFVKVLNQKLEEENPKSSPKFSSKSDFRGPNSTTKSIVKRRKLKIQGV